MVFELVLLLLLLGLLLHHRRGRLASERVCVCVFIQVAGRARWILVDFGCGAGASQTHEA